MADEAGFAVAHAEGDQDVAFAPMEDCDNDNTWDNADVSWLELLILKEKIFLLDSTVIQSLSGFYDFFSPQLSGASRSSPEPPGAWRNSRERSGRILSTGEPSKDLKTKSESPSTGVLRHRPVPKNG